MGWAALWYPEKGVDFTFNAKLVLALISALEGLVWTYAALVAYPRYAAVFTSHADPWKALVCAFQFSYITFAYAVHFGENSLLLLVHVTVLAFISPLCILSLENAVFYCRILQNTNARALQRPEIALQYAVALLVHLCALAPTLSAVPYDEALWRECWGVYIIASLITSAHLSSWTWAMGRMTYARLHLYTLLAYLVSKFVFVWSLQGA